MNKVNLTKAIAQKTNIEEDVVDKVLNNFEIVAIAALLTGQKVRLPGFVTISTRFRKARKGVNPQNPSERIDIPGVHTPKFKAGSRLKRIIKEKGADENS